MLRRLLPEGAQETVGTARFETFLRRLLSVKGVVAPAVEPKLSAGIDLLRPPWELGESALLAGWRGFDGYVSVAAGGAGNFSMVELRPSSGVIALVERVTFNDTGGGQDVTIGIRDSRPAGSVASTNLGAVDGRNGSVASVAAAPACRLFGGANNTAVGLTPIVYTYKTGTQSMVVPGPWVLPPLTVNASATFQVLMVSANLALAVAVRWWERAVEPSEIAAR